MSRLVLSRRGWGWVWIGITAVGTVVWTASLFFSVGYRDDRPGMRICWCGVFAGCVEMCIRSPDPNPWFKGPEPGLGVKARAVSVRWLPMLRWRESFFDVVVPLWMPMVITGLLGLFLWRGGESARCASAGQCLCGYDLAGLAAGAACPECGRKAVA